MGLHSKYKHAGSYSSAPSFAQPWLRCRVAQWFSSPGNSGISEEMKEAGSPEEVRRSEEGGWAASRVAGSSGELCCPLSASFVDYNTPPCFSHLHFVAPTSCLLQYWGESSLSTYLSMAPKPPLSCCGCCSRLARFRLSVDSRDLAGSAC